MVHWGDRYLADDGPPVVVHHKLCGGEVDDRGYCERCGKRLGARDAYAERGPGLTAATA
jgi:hypothetical protein